MSLPLPSELFEAPVLLIEARFRDRALCARVLSPRSPRGFIVGSGRRADAPVDPRYLPGGPAANDNHELVAPSGAGFVVNLSPAMRARAHRTADGLRVACGEVVFEISAVAPPPFLPRAWLRPGWRADARITGAVALGLMLLIAVVSAVPSDPHAISLDDVGRTIRMGEVRLMAPVAIAPPPTTTKHGQGPSAGGGARAPRSGPTGFAGAPKALATDERRATRGLARRQDARAVEAYVRTNTLLSILDGDQTRAVTEVFSETAALGDHATEVLAHLEGAVIAEAFGAHGLGARGTGAGGGDTGKALLGDARGLKTIGVRRRPGGEGLDDRTGARFGEREPPRVPEVLIAHATVRGALDKEIVRRVVRQHLNEVRYCYEQALPRRPTLAGRVVAMFTISANGTVIVSALQGSTLGDPAVEACIVSATRRWLFPQPQNAGIVTVSYPFQLAPAGG